jgi:hypothetical protein
MPRCGATFDKNNLPFGQGGLQGGFERGNNRPGAPRRCRGHLSPTNTAHPTTPAVAVGPGIPSSTEEGSSFSEERFTVADAPQRVPTIEFFHSFRRKAPCAAMIPALEVGH